MANNVIKFFAIIISEIAAIIVVHNCRSDLTFRLEGEERIVLQLGEDYVEPGYTATSMQMDLSDRVQVEGVASGVSMHLTQSLTTLHHLLSWKLEIDRIQYLLLTCYINIDHQAILFAA